MLQIKFDINDKKIGHLLKMSRSFCVEKLNKSNKRKTGILALDMQSFPLCCFRRVGKKVAEFSPT